MLRRRDPAHTGSPSSRCEICGGYRHSIRCPVVLAQLRIGVLGSLVGFIAVTLLVFAHLVTAINLKTAAALFLVQDLLILGVMWIQR
jgi:hypothetical protein